MTDDAYIQFEDDVDQPFKDLVRQTLEQSEFIETEEVGEQLVLHELSDGVDFDAMEQFVEKAYGEEYTTQ